MLFSLKNNDSSDAIRAENVNRVNTFCKTNLVETFI